MQVFWAKSQVLLLHSGREFALTSVPVGIVFGPPLANILPQDWQQTFLALGYLGLVLIVFEGVCL